MTKCMYCEYRDGATYTSMPPKYKCTITGEYHLALDDCNVEFAPVKHGRWIVLHGVLAGDDIYGDMGECSNCGLHLRNYEWDYCPNCGARMDK